MESEFKKTLQKPAVQAAIQQTVECASGADAIQTERQPPRAFEVEVNQKLFKVTVTALGAPAGAHSNGQSTAGSGARSTATQTQRARPASSQTSTASNPGEVRSSMHGLVKQLLIEKGQAVKKGQKLVIFEAMKMESEIAAEKDGTVTAINVKTGDTVESRHLLMTIGD